MDRVLDSRDLIASTPQPVDTAVKFTFFVPNVDSFTHAMMRVSYQWFGFGQKPGPCDTLRIGEVEDYCVMIAESRDVCDTIDSIMIDVSNNSILVQWDSVDRSLGYLVRHKETSKDNWEEEMVKLDTFHMIDGLKACTDYDIQVRSVCERDTSDYKMLTIKTTGPDCTTPVHDIPALHELKMSPNPSTGVIHIEFELDEVLDYRIRIIDLSGRSLFESAEQYSLPGRHSHRIITSHMAAGTYFVNIESGKGIITRKLIKY